MNIDQIENKLFEVTKEKTNIRGYWQDEKGKLYKDYIKPFAPKEGYLELENKINDLFFRGEKAVFVRGKEKAFVIYPDKQEILTYSYNYVMPKGKYSFKNLKKYVKSILNEFGGFTVIKCHDYYIFDCWKA